MSSPIRMGRRVLYVVGIAVVFLAGAALGPAAVKAAISGYISPASTSNPVALGGCVIRFDTLSASGKSVIPRIHANASHHCVGITSVRADWANGDLVVTSDESVVTTILVGTDESFAKRGLFVGPSGGGKETRIRIYDMQHHKIPAYSLKLYGPSMNLWLIAVWWKG